MGMDDAFEAKLRELGPAIDADLQGIELKFKLADADDEGGTKDIPEGEVAQFFLNHPDPPDKDWHANAEAKGWNVPAAEAAAYRLATIAAHFVTKGKAHEAGFTPDMADPKQLAMGVEVEKEHTDNPVMAARIALDHLAEIPDYYTRLKAMEDAAKAGKSKEGQDAGAADAETDVPPETFTQAAGNLARQSERLQVLEALRRAGKDAWNYTLGPAFNRAAEPLLSSVDLPNPFPM